eukprot:scaffold310397_cov14-Tisochrysis_lutea.AAC.1
MLGGFPCKHRFSLYLIPSRAQAAHKLTPSQGQGTRNIFTFAPLCAPRDTQFQKISFGAWTVGCSSQLPVTAWFALAEGSFQP